MSTSDYPLAYFLTLRPYGTWLHGDARGSVDNRTNRHGEPRLAEDSDRNGKERSKMVQASMRFDPAQQTMVEKAIRGVCAHRGWSLHALHVGTLHLHVVVTALARPEYVLTSFKAWATRRLKDARLIPDGRRVWSHHGSTRYLWTEADVHSASLYVTEGQNAGWPPRYRARHPTTAP